MTAWNNMSPALRGGLAAAVLAALGFGYWALFMDAPRPEMAEVSEAERALDAAGGEAVAAATGDAEVAPDAREVQEAGPDARAEVEPLAEAEAVAEAPTLPLPEFDLVRVESDGSAVIAGNAAPGDAVSLLLDGLSIADAKADGAGAFVAFAQIVPAETPRVLTLLAKGEGGERRSKSSVIVAPLRRDVPEDSAGEAVASAESNAGSADTGNAPQTQQAQAGTSATDVPEPLAAISPDAPPAPATSPADPAPQGEDVAAGMGTAEAEAALAAGTQDESVTTEMASVGGSATEGTAAANQGEGVAEATSLASNAVAEDTGIAAEAQLPPQNAAGPEGATATTPSTAAPETALSASPAEASAPQVLVASDEGLRVLQPSAEASAVPLRVETIGYAQGGVTLAGRGDGGPSDLRIYLDNAPVAETPLATDGSWETALNGVEPGTYTLRVDQIGEDGKVTSRFETPFLRETEEALARSAPTESEAETLAISVITVQPGYSLWAIATDRYGDGMAYHKVLAANADQIRDPDLIYPGQIFDLPK